jgi:glycosyltransferase involved in cell wall biosynthesis
MIVMRRNKTERAKKSPILAKTPPVNIAVCIPLHAPHLKYLDRCLRSIQYQTRKPDQIHISVSSCTDEDIKKIRMLLFELKLFAKIHSHSEKLLAGANRNRAAKAAVESGATILSFFDVDDIMHPRRIEICEQHFLNNTTLTGILNRYMFGPKEAIHIDLNTIQWMSLTNAIYENAFNAYDLSGNTFNPIYLKGEYILHNSIKGIDYIAHGSPTVLSSFWEKYPYSETIRIGEDQHFTNKMVSINNNLAYVPDILSIYTTSDRTEFHCVCSACNKKTVTDTSIETIQKNRDIAYDSYLKSVENITTSEIKLGIAYNEMIRIQERINELAVSDPTK